MIEEMDLLIRENIKSKNFLNYKIQENWNTMKCQNVRKIEIKSRISAQRLIKYFQKLHGQKLS